MKTFGAALALLAVSAGCAQPSRNVWVSHPHGLAGFEQDRADCSSHAAQIPQVVAPLPPATYPTSGGFTSGFHYGLGALAYHDAAAAAAHQRALRGQVFVSCLRSRGYHVSPVEDSR